MEIKRGVYLDKLIRKKKNGLIKVVTGVRRCGKSYLLFRLFHDHLLGSGVPEDHIIEIALDDRSNKALRDPDAMLMFIKENVRDNGDYYIVLDEVQYLDEFEDDFLEEHDYSREEILEGLESLAEEYGLTES